jgi:hypothetical protein
LERIRDLLLKHNFLEQATVVAEIVDLAHLGDPSFADRLGGGELWGSAGSIADIVDLRRSLEPVDPDTERDSVELIHTLIRLADDMRAQGIASERSEFVGNEFRRGLDVSRRRRREE